jgi:hypothetical protein
MLHKDMREETHDKPEDYGCFMNLYIIITLKIPHLKASSIRENNHPYSFYRM